ncbi:TonB family protein [Lysobacter sp. A289]
MADRLGHAAMLAVLATSAFVTGCGPAPVDGTSSAAAGPAVPARDVIEKRIDPRRGDLAVLAMAAMAENRIHSPVGDSAIDYYLALREQRLNDAGVGAALAELSPYMVIATEQAIVQEDVYEADRLLALLRRIDADTPALPRLGEGLQALHQARQAEMERAASESSRRASTSALVLVADPGKPAPTAAAAPAIVASPSEPPAQPPRVELASVEPVPPPTRPQSKPKPAIPRLLQDAAPRYPLSALRRGIEGHVQVAFTIKPDGSVSAPRLLSANPEGVFDEAAIAAARRWRFEPGATAVTTNRVVNFTLPEG